MNEAPVLRKHERPEHWVNVASRADLIPPHEHLLNCLARVFATYDRDALPDLLRRLSRRHGRPVAEDIKVRILTVWARQRHVAQG